MSSVSVVDFHPRGGLAAAIAENVRVECARVGLNQSELARRIGVSSTTVNNRWFGARQWQLEDLEAIAAATGLDLSRLLSLDSYTARDLNPEPAD